MINIVVSPYLLTSREPAAMAALLLADTVYTILPIPEGGETRAAIASAMSYSPAYARLLRNWLALGPLFEAGVIRTLDNGGADPALDVHHMAARIEAEESWSMLRAFAGSERTGASEDELDRCAADLLKGGPDPGRSVPIGAGLDAFAAARDFYVCRAAASGQGSLAQQVESRLGELRWSVGLPILKQTSASFLQYARERLAPQLRELRRVFLLATTDPSQARAVRATCSSYAAAFREQLGRQIARDDESGRRVVEGFVSISCRAMPVDATLISAIGAFQQATGQRGRVGTLPVSESTRKPLLSLTITAMDVRTV